jgi:DNA polymerase-3 subunit delta
MVARQVRLLLIAREVSADGGGEREMVAASGAHPFVARKLLDQCRRFSESELRDMYRQLDDLDEASKTGKASLEVGLETLVAQVAREN